MSISNLFEINLKYVPIEKQKMGVSDNFKHYLERLKSDREKILGKSESENINPLRQFGKTETVNSNPNPMKQFGVEI